MTKKTATKKKSKQTWIEGTKPEVDESLSGIVAQLYDVRDERMSLTKAESDLAAELIAEMKQRGIETYYDPIHSISVTLRHSQEKVTLSRKSAESGDDGDE